MIVFYSNIIVLYNLLTVAYHSDEAISFSVKYMCYIELDMYIFTNVDSHISLSCTTLPGPPATLCKIFLEPSLMSILGKFLYTLSYLFLNTLSTCHVKVLKTLALYTWSLFLTETEIALVFAVKG